MFFTCSEAASVFQSFQILRPQKMNLPQSDVFLLFPSQIQVIQSDSGSVNVVVVVVRQRYLQLTENFLKGENPAVVRSRLSLSRAAEELTDRQTDAHGNTHNNTTTQQLTDAHLTLLCGQCQETELKLRPLFPHRKPRPSGEN